MESIEQLTKTSKSGPSGFVKHVFNFDDETKSDVMNILQYAFLAIIPIIVLNKTIAYYISEADDAKSSLELSIEIVLQITIMLVGLFLIHRLITYVPTFSETKYPETTLIHVILSSLMIVLSLQSKMGEKANILAERVVELWNGKPVRNAAQQQSQQNQTLQEGMTPAYAQTQMQMQGVQGMQGQGMTQQQQHMAQQASTFEVMPANEGGTNFGSSW